MQPRSSIVVIGGGIFGVSAAYHLARAGAGRITLLERTPRLASQTTGAGAGFVSLWSGGASEPELWIERYGLQFYRELGARHEIGLKPVGTLFVALTEQGAAQQRRQFTAVHTRLAPGEVRLLEADEVCALAPIFAREHVRSGLFFPSGLRVNTTLAAQAIGRELASLGVGVCTSAEVTALLPADGHIRGVRTARGDLASDCVVLAAGAWTGELLRTAGITLPLFPLPVGRVVTTPLPGLPANLPTVLLSDFHGVYFREEAGGLLFGTDQTLLHGPELMRQIADAAGFAPTPALPRDVAAVPSELHAYHEWVARTLSKVVPALRDFGVQDARYGLPVRTPDQRHVLGEVPGVAGLFIISGDNECGVTRGPGLAQLLTELITTGSSTPDITALQPGRWR